MKRKILKFLGLALYSDLKTAQSLTNELLDKMELGEQFKVLKEGEWVHGQDVNSNVVIRNKNSMFYENRTKGTVFVLGWPYGDHSGSAVMNNIIEPSVVN